MRQLSRQEQLVANYTIDVDDGLVPDTWHVAMWPSPCRNELLLSLMLEFQMNRTHKAGLETFSGEQYSLHSLSLWPMK